MTEPWGSAPRPPRRIDKQVADAYRAAGWDLTPGGKPIAPVGFGQIRPAAQPPGLSRMPAPNREWGNSRRRDDRPPSPVPYRVASLAEVPDRLRALYAPARGGSASTGYTRGPHGDVLASYRDAKLADPLAEPITKRRTLTKDQWATLLAVAEPGPEREHLLRDAALNRIKIEG
jgi:hypothetical protein